MTPPTTASSSTPTQTITTLSNNLYNNNHLYQHHNATTTLSGSGHHSKHNSSGISGASAAISHHHPTPIEGLTALSSIGSSALHLTNPICGGNSNSLTSAELGMSHWLDGGSNSGKKNSTSFIHTVNKDSNHLNQLFLATRLFFLQTLPTLKLSINNSQSLSSAVKAEIKSPATIVDANGLPLGSSHLDSTLFCSTNLDATQGSNAYDHKQEYYNYYR